MESLEGQELIWQLMFSFADSMALKCAIELRIADIIHSHGRPITLSQIASDIQSKSVDIPYLSRIMRFLVRKSVFIEHHDDHNMVSLYELSSSSRWLLQDSKSSLAPMVLMQTHPWTMRAWQYLGECVREGGIAFERAHGCGIWEFASAKPEFNKLFNEAMVGVVRMQMEAVLSAYKDGFASIKGAMVDVGGGTGEAISQIVKSHPHIRGINFDLPHVIATASELVGVTHVGGNMFHSIPTADTIFMKWVLHDSSDEDCLKILRNCREAISDELNGKIIIVDVVLEPTNNQMFDDIRMAYDLVMMALSSGGKERTELEWKNLLSSAGFPRYKITKIPTLISIIEAFLN